MTDLSLARGKGYSLNMVILCCFMAIIGALLLFMAALLMPKISGLLETNAVERAKETIQQGTKNLELYVDGMLSSLQYTSTVMTELLAGEENDFSKVALLADSDEDIVNIAFFDGGGGLICGTGGECGLAGEDIRAQAWFQKALERQGSIPYFSRPYVQHLFQGQRRWVVSVAKAVEYVSGGVSRMGVLLMDFDYAAIASVLTGVNTGASGYAYIIDEEDEWIYHPRLQLIYAGVAGESLSAVQAQVTGVCRDIQEDRERVLVINTVGRTRWRMVGVAYIDEILSLQNAFVHMFTIALLCGGMLSIAAASLTAYTVTRPIEHLQDKMRQVEEGNLNTAISERGFREIRSLSATFNHMLRRIRALMDQIVKEQEAKRLHELNALQAQINPHFLYNALDSIIWMEERGRSEEAIAMTSALAKLFRISISKGRNIITVREEMEHVRNYLIIQEMRFRNKFTYEMIVDENTLGLRTVKLIVQPLVENAVHHGIYTYGEDVLRIVVRTSLEGGSLIISVQDDGVGIPEDKLETILTATPDKSGIGLRNVNERIQLTCGKQYGLSVKSGEGEGTLVEIRLPANMEE